MKSVFLVVLAVLFLGTLAYGWEIAAGPSYQDLELSGKVKSEGTEINLKDDLGLSDDDPIGINLRLDAGKHHLSFDYASVEFSGIKTLSKSIEFGGKTYSATTSVESKLEYALYEAQYSYDLVDFKIKDMGIALSPLFKASIYDANVNIKSSVFNESYAELLPLPTLGLAAKVEATKYLDILAQANGIGYSGDSYLEYKIAARIKPVKYFNLDVGYKGMEVDFSDGNDMLELKTTGPFILGSFVLQF